MFGYDIIYFYAAFSAAFGILFFYILIKFLAPETRVLHLNDDDGRLNEIRVNQETARSLKQTNQRKWFKWGKPYLSVRHGKRVTTFLGKMGTAYTWKVEDGEIKKWGTFWEALQALWDKELIKKIPPADADKLKTSEVYVTINLKEGITPTGFEPMTEDALLDEANIDMAKDYAEGAKGARKTALLPILMAAGSGGLVTVILFAVMGWLKIGATTVVQQSTAKIISVLVNLI